MNYIGVIHEDPDSDFGVSFLDFPGCTIAGRTLDEVKAIAIEALEGHLSEMRAAGEPIPAPSSLDAMLADLDLTDGVVVPVRGEGVTSASPSHSPRASSEH